MVLDFVNRGAKSQHDSWASLEFLERIPQPNCHQTAEPCYQQRVSDIFMATVVT